MFGEYVLTPEVFEILEEHIQSNLTSNGEIQLTDALDEVRRKTALYGVLVDGVMFDTGIPEAYVNTVAEFAKTGLPGGELQGSGNRAIK